MWVRERGGGRDRGERGREFRGFFSTRVTVFTGEGVRDIQGWLPQQAGGGGWTGPHTSYVHHPVNNENVQEFRLLATDYVHVLFLSAPAPVRPLCLYYPLRASVLSVGSSGY